jgi:hypothetical protein
MKAHARANAKTLRSMGLSPFVSMVNHPAMGVKVTTVFETNFALENILLGTRKILVSKYAAVQLKLSSNFIAPLTLACPLSNKVATTSR